MAERTTPAIAELTLPRPWLIVSDLDGTILDHWTYSPDAMMPALKKLEAQHIPVVFNTSKTAAELELLRHDLHNRHPFIVENGSAIYLPRHYFSHTIDEAESHGDYQRILLGAHREDLHRWLEEIRVRLDLKFLSFADMDIATIVELTGMNEANAALAQQREFSEVICWHDTSVARQKFQQAAEEAGFRLLQGGRFLHLLGTSDKGRAAQRLLTEFRRNHGTQPSLIACGDGNNDVEMLQVADLALLVRSPNHDLPVVTNPKGVVVASRELGPQGLARLLLEVLSLY